eukprot:3063150-Alexandrium_andersonii.AAC.1
MEMSGQEAGCPGTGDGEGVVELGWASQRAGARLGRWVHRRACRRAGQRFVGWADGLAGREG